MFKYTDTYTDLNGTERTETVYFNLNQADIIEMEVTSEIGLLEKLQNMIDAKKATEIMMFFNDLIAKSYGEKSDDGRRFIKSPELFEAFKQTQIYEDLYINLVTDAEFGSKFITSIVPDMTSFVDKMNANSSKNDELMKKYAHAEAQKKLEVLNGTLK